MPEIRLIDEKGEQIGIIETTKALEIAREKEFDLIEVSPNSKPPVCRLVDWGKYRYKLAKQERLHKANQKRIEVKGVRFTLRTDMHDLEFKAKQAEKFLKQGHKVKIDLILKGREKAHQDLAQEKLNDFVKKISELFSEEEKIVIEQKPKKSPHGLITIIAKA